MAEPNPYAGLDFIWSSDPALVDARTAARAGELEPALAAIEAESGDARSFAIHSIVYLDEGVVPPREALRAAAEAQPSRAAIPLLYGAWVMEYGWSIRGGGVASGVSDEEFASFHAALRKARTSFEEAARLDPSDATPWTYLIEIARCTSRPDEAQRCFDEATARDPDSYVAHRQLLSSKTKKWGGSEEQMMAFVDEVRGSRPPGTLLHMLEVDAQIERWLYRFGFQDDQDAALELARDEQVNARIDAAVAAASSAPNFRDRRNSLQCRNALAFWYYMSGRIGDMRPLMVELDGVFTEAYWGFLNIPPLVYARARFRAGLGPDPMAKQEEPPAREQPPANIYAPQASEGEDEPQLPRGPGMLIYGIALITGAMALAYFALSKGWGFGAWLGVFILGVSGISVVVSLARGS